MRIRFYVYGVKDSVETLLGQGLDADDMAELVTERAGDFDSFNVVTEEW